MGCRSRLSVQRRNNNKAGRPQETGRRNAGMTSGTDTAPSRGVSPLSAIALAVVTTLGTIYIVSQFIRNSIGVIAPNLASELGLAPIEIGMLSSIYFFVFAATQLPLGVALDRFGPRKCLLICIFLTALGCFAFAWAQSAGQLVASRALLGFATSSFLMAPVALYARWFPPSQFSTFAGIQLGIGSLGALFATVPLAFATANFGWRAAFVAVGILAAVIGVICWFVVNDDPPGQTPKPHNETLKESVAGIWQVIRTPSIGRVFFIQFISYPSYLLIVGLWGGPYLTHIYGYDLTGRGEILFLGALAQVLGSFFWGPSDRLFRSYKIPVLIGSSFALTALLTLCIGGVLPTPVLIAAFIMIGLATGLPSLVMAHGRSLVAPHLLGRTMTLLNIGAMGGGFVVQSISGMVIELFASEGGTYPLEAYRWVFGLQAVLVLAGIIAYSSSKTGHLAR
jgi:MFS family permease